MEHSESRQALNRRKFLKNSVRGAGILAVASASVAVSRRWLRRNERAVSPEQANPYAYRVDHLGQIDPKLIQYTQAGQFRTPRSEARRLAIGPDDRIYIAAGNYVSVVGADGSMFLEMAFQAPPRCLAVADGLLYAGLRDHIEVFDSKGQRRAAWEVPGARTWFTGLAAGPNELYAADAANRIVLRYDRSGKLLGRIGEKNPARQVPGFIVPSPYFDLELAADGLLRVTNPGRHQVETFTTQGDFEFSWGRASAAIDGFCGCCNPINLALLPDGSCITCEKGLPRVKVYSPQGKFESVVASAECFPENRQASSSGETESAPSGLDAAVDSRGRVCILDLVASEVRIMAKSGPAPTPSV